VPVIEIKGTELDDPINFGKSDVPFCKIFCELAGHKSYN